MTAREEIERELGDGPTRPWCPELQGAAERVIVAKNAEIERLVHYAAQLKSQTEFDDKELGSWQRRADAAEQENERLRIHLAKSIGMAESAEQKVLALEDKSRECYKCARRVKSREKKVYRDRLDRMVSAYVSSGCELVPSSKFGESNKDTVAELLTRRASALLAAIDAHVAKKREDP